MQRPVRSAALLGVFAIATGGLAAATAAPASATDIPQVLPYDQDWTDTAMITANDDWSGVPGVVGYLGDVTPDLPATTDARTLLMPGSRTVDVIANLAAPTGTGGVGELQLPDPVVALQGSGTADAPDIVVTLWTVGAAFDTVLSFVVRDVDENNDNAVQQLATQYRVGTSGDFTNLDGGYLADASVAGATTASPLQLALPAAALGQLVVQFRFITVNAAGSDEWLGIDDIHVGPPDTALADPVATCPELLVAEQGTGGSAVVSATDADSGVVAATVSSPPVLGIALTPLVGGRATLAVEGATVPGSYVVTITFTTDDAQTTTCTVTVIVTFAHDDRDLRGPGLGGGEPGPALPAGGRRGRRDVAVHARRRRRRVLRAGGGRRRRRRPGDGGRAVRLLPWCLPTDRHR